MEYYEAANYLFDLRRFRPKPGTESTAGVLGHLDDPHEGLASVQVAGSNGKGSTAKMTEAVLREAGFSVGLYTSPHLDDVRERIRVDGRKIPRSAIVEFVEDVRPYVNDRGVEGEAPTFFEVLTAMALWHFDREGVDVAILEVGIGGRYDATSVVDPVASAVTTVSLEHTGLLGDTIGEIATDKAQVAPGEGPLVTGATGDALDAVRDVAGDVVTVGESGDVETAYGGRSNHTEAAVAATADDWAIESTVPLLGSFQATNAGIAATLARQVGERVGAGPVDEATVERGLRKAHWPGRFEVMETDPLVVLDGAHNPGAVESAVGTVAEFDHQNVHAVVGVMHDKDHEAIASAVPADHVVACRPDVDRAEDEEIVAAAFRDAGVPDVETERSVKKATERALAAADLGDMVIVMGSLFTVSEARPRWTCTAIPKTVEDAEDARAALRAAQVDERTVEQVADDAVGQTVKVRVRHPEARLLREEMLALGGECAVGALDDDREFVDVVLTGSASRFDALLDVLPERDAGSAALAGKIRRAIEGAPVGSQRIDAADAGDAGTGDYPWSDGTAVMGILNVTPDSFHDGGEYDRLEDAVRRAEEMVEAGADIVDVGGESTRPGAEPVPVEAEIDRVVPVIERLADLDAAISVDTRKAAVGRAALEAGADVLNDVSGLEDPELRFLAAEYDVPVIVMHSVNAPVDPDAEPTYDDVVEDVVDELNQQVLLAEKAGLDREQIVVDPGLGFGKRAAESFELLSRIGELRALGTPVMVGHSHKSMFAAVGAEPGDAPHETVAATAFAARAGADVIRVHDVAENVAAVRTAEGVDDPDTLE
ncbi:MAG: dihydropteroate synthase [Halobacteriales archaeon]